MLENAGRAWDPERVQRQRLALYKFLHLMGLLAGRHPGEKFALRHNAQPITNRAFRRLPDGAAYRLTNREPRAENARQSWTAWPRCSVALGGSGCNVSQDPGGYGIAAVDFDPIAIWISMKLKSRIPARAS